MPGQVVAGQVVPASSQARSLEMSSPCLRLRQKNTTAPIAAPSAASLVKTLPAPILTSCVERHEGRVLGRPFWPIVVPARSAGG